jgi:uncharacterized damage-inducible protein DinB
MAPFTVEFYRELLDYAAWGRERILSTAAKLSEGDFDRACGLDYPSIRHTLAHQLGAETMLLGRWSGTPRSLAESQVPNLTALQDAWQAEDDQRRAFLGGIDDSDLDRVIEFTTRSGARGTEVLWQSMFQLINHATQHRSEIALVLTQMGHSPGPLDYSVFVRERDRG